MISPYLLQPGQSIEIHSLPSPMNGKPLPERGIVKEVKEVYGIYDKWKNRVIRLTITQSRKERDYDISFYCHNIEKIETL